MLISLAIHRKSASVFSLVWTVILWIVADKNREDEHLIREAKREKYGETENTVQAYFRSMGDIPLLTREEELSLSVRIQEGKMLLLELIQEIPCTDATEEMAPSEWRCIRRLPGGISGEA